MCCVPGFSPVFPDIALVCLEYLQQAVIHLLRRQKRSKVNLATSYTGGKSEEALIGRLQDLSLDSSGVLVGEDIPTRPWRLRYKYKKGRR